MRRRTTTKHERDGDAPDPLDARAAGRVMTMDEIVETYANEWVFMEITERDEHGHPWRGRVLAHDKRRGGIQPTAMEVLIRVKETGVAPEDVLGYTIIYGVKLFCRAEEWEEYKRHTGLFGGGRDRREQ
jgi:hypothetical protein